MRSPKVWNQARVDVPDDAVYVGRPTKWGNPFRVGPDGSRDAVIRRYHKWLERNAILVRQLHELQGKDLVCYCMPEHCHAEVLLAMANGLPLPEWL